MADSLVELLDHMTQAALPSDENGWSILHHKALAGSLMPKLFLPKASNAP